MERKGEPTQQEDKKRTCDDDWDVITATTDGGVIWRRYRDGRIVVTGAGELPQEAVAREEGSAAPGVTKHTYAPGDFVKVEFPDKAIGTAEWMWVRVTRCDDEKQLVFGTLDSEPLNDYDGQIGQGRSWPSAFPRFESTGSRPSSRGSERDSTHPGNYSPHNASTRIFGVSCCCHPRGPTSPASEALGPAGETYRSF